jgi:hypothetical protein
MGMMERMMEFMMGRMSKEEKDAMMDKFFADMTADDKQKMMAEMMPKMMEGVDMKEMMPQIMMSMMEGGKGKGGMPGTMSKMMEGGDETEMPMMASMMLTMMPQCVEMVLPETPKKERRDYVLQMVSTLVEHGSVGMSEEKKREFVAEVVEKVKA